MLKSEANIDLVYDSEFQVNDEKNYVALDKEIKKKGKDKGKEKSKKRKDMEFHWSKRSTRNQKQLPDLEDEVTHLYTEHNLSFKVVQTNFDALLKIMVEESHLYDQQNDREL